MSGPVWLFDLDNTLHDAGAQVLGEINLAMTEYVQRELGLTREAADTLRRGYWQRYGATLLGLIRHHAVSPAHFLHHTHRLPELEATVRDHPHDRAALRRLPGRRYILTNAPLAYAERVLAALGIAHLFDGLIPIERMTMFGHWRPKPDARMLRRVAARLRVAVTDCVLVEDTLVHQKAARGIGMRTVWMQRWLKHKPGRQEVGVYLHRKPTYVCARIRTLKHLRRLPYVRSS